MNFYEKSIDCTNLRVGDYWSAFEGCQDPLPFFPKFNSLSVESTKYSNRFRIKISNNGAFGFNYSLTQGQYSSLLKREYSILFILLKLICAAYYVYFVFASFAFEDRADFDKYMEYLFFIMVPITIFLAISYNASKRYFKIVENFVLKYRCTIQLPACVAPFKETVEKDSTFDQTYEAVSKLNDMVDDHYYVDFETYDPSGDLAEMLREALLTNLYDEDDESIDYIEKLNIEFNDVTYNAAPAVYNIFETGGVEYNQFVLKFERFLSETDAIHGCKCQKIYIASGDLDKEHISDKIKFGIVDNVAGFFLVVYPDETIVVGFGRLEE